MIPKEKLEKIRKAIRRIEITTRKVVNETLAGQYHSVFKGKGMEFDSVREYVPGDDVRSIDWNVTARAGRPFTKQFSEERELTVLMVVDASASMNFGTTGEFKNEQAAVVSALLAFSAIKNNDRVGLLIFSDDIELYLPPRKGRQHALRLVREVLFFEAEGKGSDINSALEYVSRTQKKKAVIFLISDFMDKGYQKSLQMLERKHDVIAIQTIDPREMNLERMGMLRMKDPETGEILVIDTNSKRWRQDYSRLQEMEQNQLERFLKIHGIDHLLLRTDRPYDSEIVKFFRKRAAGVK
jgi:uncharacterized protein (DUF58 family)